METPTVTSDPARSESTGTARPLTFERVTTTDAVWTVALGWHERILGVDAPDFFALEKDQSATRIKSGRQRTIWRLFQDGQGLVCKVYRDGGVLRRMGSALMGSRVQREFETARDAIWMGVPVPMPVAWARELVPPHDSVVITGELEDAIPLAEVKADARDDRALLEAVAVLYAQAHDAGFIHLDGHPGNVLTRREPAGVWNAWFVDLHDLKHVRGGLSTRRAARSLGQLEQYYASERSIRTRLRFLASYLKYRAASSPNRTVQPNASTVARQVVSNASPLAKGGSRGVAWRGKNLPPPLLEKEGGKMSNDLLAKGTRTLLRRVHQAARVQAVRLAWRRDRRLRVSGKYFGRIDMENGWTARVVLRLARRRIDPAPNIRDRSIHEWREAISEAVGDDRVKDGGTHSFSVARRDGLTFLVSTHRSFAEGLRGTLFGTSARRLFEHAHRLRHRDLPAPIPLGYAEQREGLVTTRSFIILPNDSTYRCAPQQVSSTSTPGSCGWIEGKPIETGSIR